MRLQLLTKEGIQESDRLVDQYTEFLNGPKEKHEGIIKVEFTLQNTQDIEKSIEYLNKLTGSVPLKQASPRGRKPSGETPKATEDKREIILQELMLNKNLEDQEKLINFLRLECNFALLTEEHMEELNIELDLKKLHKGKFQWFMRCLKLAKDPANDKFDPNLAIGIAVTGEPQTKVLIYKFKEYHSKLKVPLADKTFVFKKQSISKFPSFMNPEERLKFRKEHRELLADETKKQSKFFKRWLPDVKLPKELEVKNE